MEVPGPWRATRFREGVDDYDADLDNLTARQHCERARALGEQFKSALQNAIT